MSRINDRKYYELRDIKIKKGYLKYADGSCLIQWGNTIIVCSATLEDKVPPFLRNQGKGWLTAEYGMLPASCNHRITRDASKGKINGRSHEIQRLIGRSLRSVVDLSLLGEKTIWIDCDVIQGDGGTRTASVTGAFIALGELIQKKKKRKILKGKIIKDYIAAVSVGIVDSKVLLDLCYEEDSSADVDMNIIMTGQKKLVEVQGTAERQPFSVDDLNKMLVVAKKAIGNIIELQKKYIKI